MEGKFVDGSALTVTGRTFAQEAAHHTDEAAIGAIELGEAASAPPQRVALRRKRPVGVEPGMDEQESAVVGVGGATNLPNSIFQLSFDVKLLESLQKF